MSIQINLNILLNNNPIRIIRTGTFLGTSVYFHILSQHDTATILKCIHKPVYTAYHQLAVNNLLVTVKSRLHLHIHAGTVSEQGSGDVGAVVALDGDVLESIILGNRSDSVIFKERHGELTHDCLALGRSQDVVK